MSVTKKSEDNLNNKVYEYVYEHILRVKKKIVVVP